MEDCPTTGCEDFKAPKKFFSFGGKKPARNVADCSWDYFGCTNNYGKWPDNKFCCDMRFKACCMEVMGPQTTTHRPSGGYGPQQPEKQEIPDIFLEEDLDIPNQENPIEDVDLGDGQMIFRPDTAAVEAEVDEETLCSSATSTSYLVENPTDCSRYFSCQSAGPGRWIANPKRCAQGTVFGPGQAPGGKCDFAENVSGRCHSGRGMEIFFTIF